MGVPAIQHGSTVAYVFCRASDRIMSSADKSASVTLEILTDGQSGGGRTLHSTVVEYDRIDDCADFLGRAIASELRKKLRETLADPNEEPRR